jgi:DNA-binding LacI/PurR family transcriptional regulator
MADVARRAGVSIMTVSRVLNGFPGVKADTRLRVEKAAAALDYQANTAARVLAGGRSRTIGVIAVETEQFGPSHALFGIEAAAREAGHRLTFVTASGSGGDMTTTLDQLRTSHADGVVVVAPVRQVVDAIAGIKPGMPLVVVGGDPEARVATVTIDQREGARLATRHLLDLGHRTVHHVRGAKDWIDADARVRGWTDALHSYPAPKGRSVVGDWGAASGYAAGKRLAKQHDVTAIFAANDQTAIGVIRGLLDFGRRVPEEVSVVGFDDAPESAYLSPALTTIRQDFNEVGRRCVELLLSIIDGESLERHIVVPAELVVRESSGPPPSG